MLLLDKGSVHSLEAHAENDMLINIIFPNDKMDIDWLSTINIKNSILFDFLVQTLTTRSRKQYLIFRCADNQHVQMILEQMIAKHFTEPIFSNEIISMYIPILFTELIGNCYYDYHNVGKERFNNQIVIDTLTLIEKDYAELTLEKAAKILGYNRNYLSNVIKKKAGSTFSQLLMQQRMKQAKFLIENTQLPITEIIEKIGLKNKSHFYSHFKDIYGKLPAMFRDLKNE